MQSNWQTALRFTLSQEGTYTNVPADPGNWTGGDLGSGTCIGTNMGISAPVLAQYCEDNALAPPTTTMMEKLGILVVMSIYHAGYWVPLQGDALPAGLDLMLFDHAVNTGVGAAVRLAQLQFDVDADGVLGPETLGALQATRDVPAALLGMLRYQSGAYLAIRDWATYGKGWSRRLVARATAALNLV